MEIMCMAKKKSATARKSGALTWPNGRKVAVSVTVMFETWPDDSAPSYSVQTSHLKKGTVDHAAKAWSTYGGRVGVWRVMRMLELLGIPATFFVNARCTEQYPDAVKQIVRSGFDIAAHSYTQDDLPAYYTPEEQSGLIRRSIDLLEACGGKKVTGWGSPVVAFTPETAGLLKQAGLSWTCDVTYTDLPIRIHTPHGPIAGVPTTDFSDNRVLRASSRDLYDVHRSTFDYLRQNETIGLHTLVIHCQFGGRPLITAVLTELLKYMAKSRDCWFTTHETLADWALKQNVDEHTYQSRYFA
jgi:peptidoglycan/xylan/chitin deacetylase (PgdA/CDA1 family)